jgi:hypothetical protein
VNRREMVKGSLLGAAASITQGPVGALPLISSARLNQFRGHRFVTLCIMIRTTPWEVSRDVKLLDRDESKWHTLEGVRALRKHSLLLIQMEN